MEKIPYRFAFGAVEHNESSRLVLPHEARPPALTIPLLLSVPIYLYDKHSDPDHLCRAVALTIKALARPQAVATIAQDLAAQLQTPSATPTGVSPSGELTPLSVSSDLPTSKDPDVEITPAGTKLTQLNFASQLSDTETLNPIEEPPNAL